jgi:hypothetical protein
MVSTWKRDVLLQIFSVIFMRSTRSARGAAHCIVQFATLLCLHLFASPCHNTLPRMQQSSCATKLRPDALMAPGGVEKNHETLLDLMNLVDGQNEDHKANMIGCCERHLTHSPCLRWRCNQGHAMNKSQVKQMATSCLKSELGPLTFVIERKIN